MSDPYDREYDAGYQAGYAEGLRAGAPTSDPLSDLRPHVGHLLDLLTFVTCEQCKVIRPLLEQLR